jgi:hypothetical protein
MMLRRLDRKAMKTFVAAQKDETRYPYLSSSPSCSNWLVLVERAGLTLLFFELRLCLVVLFKTKTVFFVTRHRYIRNKKLLLLVSDPEYPIVAYVW